MTEYREIADCLFGTGFRGAAEGDAADMIRAASTDRTRAVILNSPSNPAGTVCPSDTVREIASFCSERGLYLIVDGSYDGLTYSAEADAPLGQLRLPGVLLEAQLGLGKDQIELYQDLIVGGDAVPVFGAVGGELCENAVDLGPLLGGQLP